MKTRRWSAIVGRLVSAVLLAVAVTVSAGIVFGIPRDINSLEAKLQAFERASHSDGRAATTEERDKALADAGHTFHLPSSTPPPKVVRYSIRNLVEGAVRWYPVGFCLALLGSLILLRPGIKGGLLALLVLVPFASVFGEAVTLATAVAALLYIASEIARSRIWIGTQSSL